MKRRMASAALLVLALLFFLAAVRQEKLLRPFQERLAYLYESGDSKVPSAEAYGSQEKSFAGQGTGLSALWWTEKETARITNPNLGRETAAPVLAVCGRTDLLFAKGRVLDYDQASACLLGSRTAYLLFGSPNAEGLLLDYHGTVYRVAGVLPNTEEAFVYQAGKEEALLFDRLTVGSSGTDAKVILKHKVQELLQPEKMLDYDLLILIAQLVLLLIPLRIGMHLLGRLRRYAKDRQARLAEKVAWWGCFCMVLLFLIKSAAMNLDIPSEFIPSQWSDFSFWAELWEEKRRALAMLWQQKITPGELLFFIPYGKTILYGILALLCLIHGKALMDRRKGGS